jgi:hypothetical protein
MSEKIDETLKNLAERIEANNEWRKGISDYDRLHDFTLFLLKDEKFNNRSIEGIATLEKRYKEVYQVISDYINHERRKSSDGNVGLPWFIPKRESN